MPPSDDPARATRQGAARATDDQLTAQATKSRDKPSIHSLRERARYMPLDHKPHSEAAKKFCHMVAMALTQASERKYRRRDAKQRQFEAAIGAIVADLLMAISDAEADGWGYRSSRAGTFTGEHVTYRNYQDVMEPAKQHGLIEEVKGFCDWVDFDDEKGGKPIKAKLPNSTTNRYRATKALLELTGGYGITAENVRQHFIQALPKHPIELRTASRWDFSEKIKGERMSFAANEWTKRYEEQINDLNRFLAGVHIEGGTHRGYRRIFNQGDAWNFDWDKGGRIYSQGNPSYQQLPREQRLKMKLNGEAVAEIDVRASLLTILHGLGPRPN